LAEESDNRQAKARRLVARNILTPDKESDEKVDASKDAGLEYFVEVQIEFLHQLTRTVFRAISSQISMSEQDLGYISTPTEETARQMNVGR
jgi:hypothetical protein